MNSLNFNAILILLIVFVGLLTFSTRATGQAGNSRDIPIVQTWNGDFPVDQLNLLPENQRELPVGYFDDAATFAQVWQVIKPGENLPEVDFGKNFVVFTRNVDFYNRISIVKVTVKNEAAEILAAETRSALPIEDRAAISLVVIPRRGVNFIQAGPERIAVSPVQ